MALFARRDAPPADLVSLMPRDERVLSFADTADGAVVLATPGGLWWPDGGGQRLIGWQLINKAVWREDTLSVIEGEVVDDWLLIDRPTVSVVLSRPRDLPPTIRRRVEANVVRSELRPLPGGAGRFVARRVPGRDGVVWWVRLEPGTVASDEVRSRASAELAALHAQWVAEL